MLIVAFDQVCVYACNWNGVFRYRDMVDCGLITVKAFNGLYDVSSFRLAKLSDGFHKEKLLLDEREQELIDIMSKQNTVLDGECCFIFEVGYDLRKITCLNWL